MFQHNKLKNKDIDLLRAFQEKKEPSKYASILKYAIFPVVGSIVILCIFAFNAYSNYQLKNVIKASKAETARIMKDINSNSNLERFKEFEATQNKVLKYERIYTDLQSYPQISQGTFDNIVLASGLSVKVTSFSYVRESQAISLQIEAPLANDTELFIRRLKETGIFDEVKYSGYTQQEKTVSKVEEKSSLTTQEALLQALLNPSNKESITQVEQEAQTVKVYTATVLCTLKK